MKNEQVAIDIGSNTVKLVTNSNYIIAPTVENSVNGDELIAFDGIGDYIKSTLKSNDIKAKKVSLVLPDSSLYVTRLTMPAMSKKQLQVNLPYEFKDTLAFNKDDYIYDYAMVNLIKDESDQVKQMELLAGALSKDLYYKYDEMFKKIGLKLVKVLPRVMAITNILQEYEINKDIAIVDLGYTSTKVDIYHRGYYETSRIIEIGCKDMIVKVADLLYCDSHIALQYFMDNKDNIVNNNELVEIYDKIAVQIKRAINYYTYENSDNNLEDVYLYGGASHIETLCNSIKNEVDLNCSLINDLVGSKQEVYQDALAAYGALLGE